MMDQIKKLLASLTMRQKVSIAVAAITVFAGVYGVKRWSHERDFRPLYTGLAPEDAGTVTARLREDGVDYRLGDGGATILVSSDEVAEMRLLMAAAGLPRSGRAGFELFDRTNFGATDFAEQVNFHRALEGELQRSMVSLAEVRNARVHLTLPKDSVFLSQQRPAKASVLLDLVPGARLSPQNVQAITYLVASAVEGLEPEAVSVLDMRGNLLNKPHRHPGLDAPEPSGALLEYQQSIEHDLLAKIGTTLEPLVGQGGFRAGVNVDCDFTSGEESKEIFDPEHTVMTRSERTEDIDGTNRGAGGVPGTASNLPRPVARPVVGGTNHQRHTENVAYQTSRTVRRLRLPQGTVKRISVSLLVDHEVLWQGEGDQRHRVVQAPSKEKLRVIKDLVSAAVGLQPDRGDQLIVETLPFETTRNWQSPETAPATIPDDTGIPLPAWLKPYLKDQKILAIAGAGLAIMILLLGAGGLWFLRRRKTRTRLSAVTMNKSLPAAGIGAVPQIEGTDEVGAQMEDRLAEQTALKARLEQEAVNSLKLPTVKTKKTEVLTKHLSEEAKKDPQAMAQLVRTWLNEESH